MADTAEHSDSFDRLDWLALAAIAVIAASLRVFFLELLPPGLWYDEGLNGCDVLGILRGEPLKMVYPGVFPREPLLIYLMVPFVKLLGNETFALRLPAALIGSCAPPLAYLWMRQASTRRAALFCALFLAGMRWHVHFSRIALRTIYTPTLACATFALLWLAFRTGRKRWAAAAGAVFSLGYYAYLSWYFFSFAAAFALVWGLYRETPSGKRLALGAAFCIAALAVAAPMWIHYCYVPSDFTGRTGELSLFSEGLKPALKAIAKNAREASLMLIRRGDHVAKCNIPWKPALDPIGAALWILGVVWALWALRKSTLAPVLLVWTVCSAGATIFSKTDSPNFLRTLNMTPAVAALAGIGADRLGDWIGRRRRGALGSVIASLCLAASVGTMLTLYFYVWPRVPGLWEGFSGPFNQIARYARSIGPRERLYLPPDVLDHYAYRFLANGAKRVAPLKPEETLGPGPDPNENHLVLDGPFPPIEIRAALRERFPQSEIAHVFYAPKPYGQPDLKKGWAGVWRLKPEERRER